MIHAIEPPYSGRRFRSRIEARWDVFFDALRTHYVYEPEGYDLKGSGWVRTDGPGLLYLPDFWLTDLRIYIEKNRLTQAEAAKRLGIAQSRVSDLVRGKWEKFSLEMLITLEARRGRTVRVELAA